MKKINTVLILMAACTASRGQITLTTTDMPNPGWTNVEQKDNSTGSVNWGNKGANQVYNFSSFTNNGPDTVFYLTPTTAQTNAVPTATIAVTSDRVTYLLGKNSAAKFDFEGLQTTIQGWNTIFPFNPVSDLYHFPTQYLGVYSGSSGFQQSTSGSNVGQPTVNTVRVTNNTTYQDTIDGWGKVTTPVGTYNCLRQKRVEVSNTVIDYKLFSFSSWSTLQTINTTTTRYYYLTRETHGSVISFTYDSLNNPLTASWSTTPPTPDAKFGITYGANGSVAFHDSSTGSPTTYSWNFGDGSPTSGSHNPNHSYSHDTTLVVCLTVANVSGTSTWCDTVRITNVGVPVAPTSTTDTASMIQPATLSLHVLANDSSYNTGDTVCINSVWGAPAGWATVSGCSSLTFHPLDSAFAGIDTFYYRACSVHYPSLCDTGMVVIIIHSGAPVASFSVQNVGCSGRTFISHSTGADSLFWHFSEIGATGTPFDTLIVNGTVIAVPNTQNTFYNKTMQVCLDAKSRLGQSQVCDTVYFGCGQGIKQIAANEYRIYPNPASDLVQIDLSSADANIINEIRTIEIYDMLGEKLKNIEVNDKRTSVSVNELSNGMYIIMIADRANSRKVLGKLEVIR